MKEAKQMGALFPNSFLEYGNTNLYFRFFEYIHLFHAHLHLHSRTNTYYMHETHTKTITRERENDKWQRRKSIMSRMGKGEQERTSERKEGERERASEQAKRERERWAACIHRHTHLIHKQCTVIDNSTIDIFR